ncbi:MAG: inositol monophosphatase [Streptosporangiales bacterium]|nr:inositol monophosphatase [Streptosporangiales bacterium]
MSSQAEALDSSELVELAVEAARAAGRVLLERRKGPLAVETKSSATDVVSDADRAAEDVATTTIAAARPHDAVLAEESGTRPGESGLRWVIDPLDGTVNYLYGRDDWAVSVAVEDAEHTLASAVYVPVRDEMYHATRGGGAYRNGTRLTVNDPVEIGQALLATGFSYDAAHRGEQGNLVAAVLPRVRDIRRAGACAVDLADLAAGRADAFYEDEVNHWDVAGAGLVAAEAGATVGLDVGRGGPPSVAVLVAGPSLYPAIAAALGFTGSLLT